MLFKERGGQMMVGSSPAIAMMSRASPERQLPIGRMGL